MRTGLSWYDSINYSTNRYKYPDGLIGLMLKMQCECDHSVVVLAQMQPEPQKDCPHMP